MTQKRATKGEPKKSVLLGDVKVTQELSDKLRADAKVKTQGFIMRMVRYILEDYYGLPHSDEIKRGRPRKEIK